MASPDFLFWGAQGGHSIFDGGAPLDSDRCRILHHKSQMGGHTGGHKLFQGGHVPPWPPLGDATGWERGMGKFHS